METQGIFILRFGTTWILTPVLVRRIYAVVKNSNCQVKKNYDFVVMPGTSSSRDRSISTACRDQKLLLRSEHDFDETASIAASKSSRSSRSSISTIQSSQQTQGKSGSLATSCVSLRDLELRKVQIEQELARVQQELQLRELQQATAQLQAKLQRK